MEVTDSGDGTYVYAGAYELQADTTIVDDIEGRGQGSIAGSTKVTTQGDEEMSVAPGVNVEVTVTVADPGGLWRPEGAQNSPPTWSEDVEI